ncbi:heme biosynthesis protein HemY [Pseudomonas sp. PDM14]|uniref:heme biosynthesis HemY N-terminal domain-containing protein n=1 Tax=Pseudomonas sp. PDM14 TaxID=2769288 RepID=UPI001787420B|nr:heme biosynthesis HemY N-terminal domain-containing protein [Pseudomonas sp. PDM14]MBD9483066.1 heme biosynthesis protein HemY [Pseudomonas sp. PDM14]
MIRAFLYVLLVVAAAAALGMAVVEHSGYVLIAWKGLRYESSLWVFLLLIAAALLLLWATRWLLRLLFVSGGVVNPWSRRNHGRRQQQAADKGMLELAEGRWEPALRHLQLAAEGEHQPLLHYLGAARAANKLGRHEQSDALLERALERQPQAELAIALTHAELQEARGETDAALETVQVMHERYPQHPQVLRHLLRLLHLRGDWSALLGLLPALRKSRALSGDELTTIERQVWRERLIVAGASGLNEGETTLQPLTRAWQQLSSAQRNEPELLLAYAEQLRVLGAEEEAEEVVRKALKQQYDAGLVDLYGLLRGRDPARQLQTAEGLLKAHPQDPLLLRCLGRLCLQNSLWGKAREYLEISLQFSRNAQTCAELARLLAHLGDVQQSNRLFQESFDLLDQRLPNLPLPVPAGS